MFDIKWILELFLVPKNVFELPHEHKQSVAEYIFIPLCSPLNIGHGRKLRVGERGKKEHQAGAGEWAAVWSNDSVWRGQHEVTAVWLENKVITVVPEIQPGTVTSYLKTTQNVRADK